MAINIKGELLSKLKKRFGQIEEVRLFALATIIDSRFKKNNFENPLACCKAISNWRNLVETEVSYEKEPQIEEEMKKK